MITVRTQDRKNILKTKSVSINKDGTSNEFNLIDQDTCSLSLLGTFNSQERALEVLDEIEQLIKQGTFAKTVFNASGPIGMHYYEPYYQIPEDSKNEG